MTPSILADLRQQYHQAISKNILALVTPKKSDGEDVEEALTKGKKKAKGPYFNNADGGSPASVALAKGMADRISSPPYAAKSPSPQACGSLFALHTSNFLEAAFAHLNHLRPGKWKFSVSQGKAGITAYDQYRHLADLAKLAEQHEEIRMALGGDYLVLPDIIVGKYPLADTEIDAEGPLLGAAGALARHTPFRAHNNPHRTLHASISCKWTMRSDRAQNTRTEALNLLRNRKGKSPQMIVVTAEPLPSRLVSIAVGTGDIDCTYHAALYELLEAATDCKDTLKDQLDELKTLISGRRIRDISDLPFDLAI